jgi:hypothetical protein
MKTPRVTWSWGWVTHGIVVPISLWRTSPMRFSLSPGFALGHAGLGYALAAPVVRYTALFALNRYDEIRSAAQRLHCIRTTQVRGGF